MSYYDKNYNTKRRLEDLGIRISTEWKYKPETTIMVLSLKIAKSVTYIAFFQNASEDAGRMGFMMVVAGMIGSILFGIMLDKTHKYKEINLFLYLSSALSILSLMYSLEYRSLVMTYIGCINVGTFTNSYMPVGFELAMELTFPSEESTTTGILMAGTQILGVVFTVALGYFNIWMGCFWALATQCALLFLGTVVTALVPNTLLRQEAYKESYVSSQRKVSYHGSRLVFIE